MDSVFFKPLSLTFSILVIFQSLTCEVLSLLGLFTSYKLIDYDEKSIKGFVKNFIDLYISANNTKRTNRAIISNDFVIILYLYFALSIMWFFGGISQLTLTLQKAKPAKLKLCSLILVALTTVICLFDLANCIIFGVDYDKIKTETKDESVLMVPIILMVVSAKGFILWIINITLAVIITVIYKRENDEIQKSKQRNPSVYASTSNFYNAYEDISSEHLDQDNWLSKISKEKINFNNIAYIDTSIANTYSTTWSHIPRANSICSKKKLRRSEDNYEDLSNKQNYYSDVNDQLRNNVPMTKAQNSVYEPEPDYSPTVERRNKLRVNIKNPYNYFNTQ